MPLWVLTLGGKGELAHASTQRIKITLQPVNPETGEDAQVADARRGENRPGPLRSQPSRCLGQADVGASVEAAWVLTGTGSASCMRQGPLRQAPARLPLGDRLVVSIQPIHAWWVARVLAGVMGRMPVPGVARACRA